MLIPGAEFDFAPAGTEGAEVHERQRSPFEMDLGFLVSFDKPHAFIGRAALEAEKAGGSAWSLVGLELPGCTDSPANGDEVTLAATGEVVGFVTSGLYSPSLDRCIALASVAAAVGSGGAVGTAFSVSVGGDATPAVGVAKPFVAPERKAATPAPRL